MNEIEQLLEDAVAERAMHPATALEAADYISLSSDQANRWMAELAQIRRKRDEAEEALAAAVARMTKVITDRKVTWAADEALLEEALEMYHRIKLAEDPEGSKTITLPCGTLKSKMGQPKWVVQDEAAYDAWILANLPGAVEHKAPEVNRTVAKKLLKDARVSDGRVCMADSTVVPGLVIEPAVRGFTPHPILPAKPEPEPKPEQDEE